MDDVPDPPYPTRALMRALDQHGLSWTDVVGEYRRAHLVTPSARPGVSCHMSVAWSLLVADDGHILGVAPRDPNRAPVPRRERPVSVRRGHGGAGRAGPRTCAEILEQLRRMPGYEVLPGGKHYKVTDPSGRVIATVPATPSDWRTPLNILRNLRQAGVDLRRAG